jgi:hypothetical protein
MIAPHSVAAPSPDRSPLATAAEVPRWAWSFYCRHWVWIVGLSLVPAAQRVVSQLWGDRLPDFAGLVLEALTMLVRILLFALIFRIAILRDPALAAQGESRWRRATRFARDQWPSLVLQFGMFMGVAIIFKVVPDILIAPRIPSDWSRIYWAAVLAMKNPTIIAFTMVWIVGALRQMWMSRE